MSNVVGPYHFPTNKQYLLASCLLSSNLHRFCTKYVYVETEDTDREVLTCRRILFSFGAVKQRVQLFTRGHYACGIAMFHKLKRTSNCVDSHF